MTSYPYPTDPHVVLKKYWGYDEFRNLQEDIIVAVLAGQDVLALMPTGGGKSICYQIPIIVKAGTGLIISPLIALMKDQVMQLQKRGIPAIAITSAMKTKDIERELENCIYGKYKMLYVSPERLKSEMFISRAERMNINLLAIDEAHCISQWGYDFRSAYLEIPHIKNYLNKCPMLALTATATDITSVDILEKLAIPNAIILKKSFERKNLSYSVLYDEDKLAAIKRILKNVPGSSVIYVRNRQKTEDLAKILQLENIRADFYHAGLEHYLRDRKQEDWISGKTRVIVSTNAFGMGIDKADVRTVIHLELPESMEEYYQEAGRAGRDEKKAYAVLLFNAGDPREVRERFDLQYPPLETIRRVYHILGNIYKIAYGSGEGMSYDLDLNYLASQSQTTATTVYNALKRLEDEEYIFLNEAAHHPSKIKILTNNEELYRFQIDYPLFEPLIKIILRTTEGAFDHYATIYETDYSRLLQMDRKLIIKQLHQLMQYDLLEYIPESDLPKITFVTPRLDSKSIIFQSERFNLLKARKEERLQAALHYATTRNECRSSMLLNYFDEKKNRRCGLCDYCLRRHDTTLHPKTFEALSEAILDIISEENNNNNPQSLYKIELLFSRMPLVQRNKIMEAVRFLIDHKKIVLQDHTYIRLIE